MIHLPRVGATAAVPTWTTDNRHRYDGDELCYPSDLTSAERWLIKPPIPPAKCGGGKRTVDMREVVNGIMYALPTSGALPPLMNPTPQLPIMMVDGSFRHRPL